MIVQPINTSRHPHRAAEQPSGQTQSAQRVEPVERAAHRPERRASEALANAAALRLGLAAQVAVSNTAPTPTLLPTNPAMRAAARYASTVEGVGSNTSLGFNRHI